MALLIQLPGVVFDTRGFNVSGSAVIPTMSSPPLSFSLLTFDLLLLLFDGSFSTSLSVEHAANKTRVKIVKIIAFNKFDLFISFQLLFFIKATFTHTDGKRHDDLYLFPLALESPPYKHPLL